MKTIIIITLGFVFFLLQFGCKKDGTGTLIIKGVEQLPSMLKQGTFKSTGSLISSNYHIMHTADLKTSVATLWVSQDNVIENKGDNLTWFKIGESSGLKSTHDYEFIANNLPAGNYQSVKIDFRNTIIRYAVYQEDTTHVVEMRGSLNELGCESDDIITNYFCSTGSYMLNFIPKGTIPEITKDTFLFTLMARGESVRGFTIHTDDATTIYWKLGWPGMKLTDVWFKWFDHGNNLTWECDLDSVFDFETLPEHKNKPMWTFLVDDGEIVPDDTPAIIDEPIDEPKFVVDTNYSVTDIVGIRYKAVKIGSQIWMAENLKTNKFNNDTLITNVPNENDWAFYYNNQLPAQSVYNKDVSFLQQYGRFYNWHAVSSGILCPKGWHIPSKSEWEVLLNYLGENAGLMLRSNKENYWSVPANNESKFSALPTGMRGSDGMYYAMFESASWWSSTLSDNDQVYFLNLPQGVTWHVPFENGGSIERGSGLCVRCLKD